MEHKEIGNVPFEKKSLRKSEFGAQARTERDKEVKERRDLKRSEGRVPSGQEVQASNL